MSFEAGQYIDSGQHYNKLSGDMLAEMVSEEVYRWGNEEEISEEIWKKAAGALDNIFRHNDSYLLTTYSFQLLKGQAENELRGQLEEYSNPILEKVVGKVLTAFETIFQETQANTLNEESIVWFKEIYNKFLDKFPEVSFLEFLRNRFSDEFVGTSADYRNIVVELSESQVNDIFNEYGVIQLRPIHPEAEVLIIGCGNGRTTTQGGHPFNFYDQRIVANETIEEHHKRYSLEHNHPSNIVTIDPDLSSNPTICAFFGLQPVAPLFEGKKFDRIVFEGFFDKNHPPFQREDIEALLSDEGEVALSLGSEGLEEIDANEW